MHSYLLLTVLSRDRSRNCRFPLHGTVSVLGFATQGQARQCILAESSSTLFCLWTGLSLPVALHPASRRRSYLQLRTDQCFCPIGTSTDFHPTIGAYFRAHPCGRFPAVTSAPNGAAFSRAEIKRTPFSLRRSTTVRSGDAPIFLAMHRQERHFCDYRGGWRKEWDGGYPVKSSGILQAITSEERRQLDHESPPGPTYPRSLCQGD
jgi:hypothetical protein